MTKTNFSILVHRYQKYLEWEQTIAKKIYKRQAPLDIEGPFIEEYYRLIQTTDNNRYSISDKEGLELYKITLDYYGKRNGLKSY